MLLARTLRRRVTTAILVTSLLGVLGLPASPASADTEPSHVTQIRAAVGGWGTWLGLLEHEAPFADALPLLDLSAGEALGLGQAIDDGVLTPLTTSGVLSSVSALADYLNDPARDMTVGGVQVDLAATDVLDTGATRGLTLDLTIARSADVSIQLTDPNGAGGAPVSLTTPPPGAPLTISFASSATFRVAEAPIDAQPAWIVAAGADAPSLQLGAHLGSESTYDFPAGAPGAIGVGDVVIGSGSSITLDAAWAGTIDDSDGNGILAFFEPASDPSLPDVPGELTLDPAQLVTWDRTGSAAAHASITSGLVDLSGPVALDVTTTDLGPEAAAPAAAVTGDPDDVAELAGFARLLPFDLLNGLTQYATLLRGAQKSPNSDFELPLVGGRSSDLLDLAADVSAFIDARITPLENGSGGQPADPSDPDGAIPFSLDFATVGGLLDRLDDEAWYTGDTSIADVVYDEGSDRLTIDVAGERALPTAFAEIFTKGDDGPVPLAPDSPVLHTDLGSELLPETGLRTIQHDGSNPQRQARTSYSFSMPLVVDLGAPCTTGACAEDDPGTQGVVEFEDPMPFERFLVDTGTGTAPEASLVTIGKATLAGTGQVGFVPVTLLPASSYLFDQDGAAPTTTIALDGTAVGLGQVSRIGLLLKAIADQGDAGDPVLAATPKGATTATLKVQAHGADPTQSLTEGPATVTVSSTKIVPPYGGDVTLDATAQMLKRLDVDTSEPTALLGRFLDVADGVAEGLDALPGGDALITTDIPFVGESAKDLLGDLVDLGAGFDAVRTGPTPVTLADLETKIETALALEPGELLFELRDVTGDGKADLVARFAVDRVDTTDVPIRLPLAGLGELSATGVQATTTAELDLGVVIPLDGTVPAGPPQVLKAGGFNVTAAIDDGAGNPATNLEVTGVLGPFEVRLGDAANPTGRVQFGAELDVQRASADEDAAEPITDFIAGLDVTAGPSAGGPFTCAPPDPNAAETPPGTPPSAAGALGCVSVPVFVNGALLSGAAAALPEPDDYLTVAVDGLTTVSATPPSGLESFFDAEALSFESLDDGFASILQILELATKASTFGSELPLVGDDLAAGADLLGKMQSFLENPFAFVLSDVGAATVGDFLLDDSSARSELAAKLSGLGILRDADYVAPAGSHAAFYDAADADADYMDIRVVPMCGAAVCAPDAAMKTVSSVTFEMDLGQGARQPVAGGCAGSGCPTGTTEIPLDLGIDGLPLGITAQLTANAGWTVELGFGVSREEGFFLLDNPMPGTGTPDVSGGKDSHDDELRVGSSVELKQAPADGPEATGILGFIEVTLEDQSDRGTPDAGDDDTNVSHAGILAKLGLGAAGASCATETVASGPANCTNHISLGDLANGDVLDAVQTPVVSADVDVDLELTTGLDAGDSPVADLLPTFKGDFELDWTLASDGLDSLAAPEISFSNLRINVKALFDNALGELLKQVDTATDPLDPVREVAFAPIPVISDLSRMFGGGDVTMVDLAELFGNVDLGLLEDINRVLSYLEVLGTIAESGDIPLGGFDVDGALAQRGAAPTPDQADDLIAGSPDADPALAGGIKEEMLANLEASGGDSEEAAEKLADLSAGSGNGDDFTFNLLDEPECMFGLLLGKDCPIFEWRPDVLSIDFEYEQSFGPFFGVLYVTLGGELHAHANLGVGFSTRGIRLLGEDLMSGSGTTFGGVAERFAQSIYLTDLDAAGTDIDEIELSAEITAGGKISVVIAEAGVRGGLRATVTMNWHDGPTPPAQVGELDGRLYIDEVLAKIATPLCLMDLNGRLEAFLEVYAQLGVCPFCVEKSFELASIVLLELSSECEAEPPNLADVVNDEVVLNVGSRKELRNIAESETNEAFVVRQLSGPDDSGNYRFSINAFGIVEEETGKLVRVLDAQDGDDSFVFQGVKQGAQAGEVGGGTADDTNAAAFTAPVKINEMGLGNDTARTGDGGDEVHGGGDSDSMVLGGGADYGFGDDGADSIFGEGDEDELHGGAGDDSVDGGLAHDDLFGDAGHDLVVGGSDVTGPPAQADDGDNLHGGPGNDTLDGGSGADNLYGDGVMSDDTDGLLADTDPNSADDAGADRIMGGAGVDTAWGGAGDDLIVGGFGDPSQGNDTSGDHLHGNGGADEIYGRDGGDDLWGGSGPDRLYGEVGDDDVHGQAGHDPDVRGGAGNDDVLGGGGNDVLFGDDGDDDLTGDGDGAPETGADAAAAIGSDIIDGGSQSDIVVGDNGTIADPDSDGGTDRTASPSQTVGVSDTIQGGPDDDALYGEGGDDHLFGGGGKDLIHGNGGKDDGSGDDGDDEMWGDADDDTFNGAPGADLLYGNGGVDTLYGQAGDDDLVGGSDTARVTDADDADEGDNLYGGYGDDRMYGDNVTGTAAALAVLHAQPAEESGTDTLDGGPNEDEGHGQDDADLLYGGPDHDQLFGELAGDVLHGQDGPDALFGDKGQTAQAARSIAAPSGGWPAGTPAGSPAWSGGFGPLLVDEGQGGQDTLHGGPGDDHAYGGADVDTINGGADDDHIEGNAGRDNLYGYAKDSTALDGQDDLIGGSSAVSPSADPPDGANTAGSSDQGELEMQGNGAQDVLTGDNASQVRTANGAGTAWAVDPVTGGRLRTVTLFDTEETGAGLQAVSGDDLMAGNDANDRLFGEGGDDLAKGNGGQDLLEGNQGRDWLEGNDQADDLVGGSSVGGQPDDGDQLHGGAGPDVLAGDNACIVRKVDGVTFAPSACRGGASGATAFTYETYQLGIDPQRGILLRDLASFVDTAAGPDVLSGGEGVDVELGQDEADKVQGGPGDDYQQGNGAGDTLVGDSVPNQLAGLAPLGADLADDASAEPQLSGAVAADGQDDQIGGSNLAGHRDTADTVYGDGAADFQLGDNGQLTRTISSGSYAVYEERYPNETAPAGAVVERAAQRFDVNGAATAFGGDTLYGGDGIDPTLSIGAADGDDSQWGQDGADVIYGEDDADDQYGELGDDVLWGGAGEDAMLGDRGGIETRYVDGVGADPSPAQGSFDVNSPPGIEWKAWAAHPLDRRVSLTTERYSTTALASPGLTVGGSDQMHGGPGHDSMHGAYGDDLMNGDSGGDYVFGADGADVMWGGRGKPGTDPQPTRDDPGTNGGFLDILYGGYGSSKTEAGADIMDYQPRPGTDPASWFTMTDDYESATVGDRQHHHGTDWIYGGWDRDVLQADVSANGPNDGDKLLDWDGAYNLYTACNSAYGGWNDVRKLDPANIQALEKLAWTMGAGTSLENVRNATTSGGREAAIVYTKDLKNNSGRAFSSTPGHFEQFICTSD
jgi:Ca2+-binding RTX toxin-like protein